ALGVERQDQTRRRGPAVEQDGAGAAVPRVAREVRPGEPEIAAEELEKRAGARDVAVDTASVDRQLERIAVHRGAFTHRRAPGGPGRRSPHDDTPRTPARRRSAGRPPSRARRSARWRPGQGHPPPAPPPPPAHGSASAPPRPARLAPPPRERPRGGARAPP